MAAFASKLLLIVALSGSGASANSEQCNSPGGCTVADSAAMLQSVQKVARHNVSKSTVVNKKEPTKCDEGGSTFDYCNGDLTDGCHKKEPKKGDGKWDPDNMCFPVKADGKTRDDIETYQCKHTHQRFYEPCLQPLNIWLLLDDSGSVKGDSKSGDWQALITFVGKVVEHFQKNPADGGLQPKSRIAASTFSNDPIELTGIADHITQGSKIKDELIKFTRAGDFTHTAKAFDFIRGQIPDFGKDSFEKGKTFVIIVTDGKPNEGSGETAAAQSKAKTAAEKLKDGGVQIIAAGVGSGIQASNLAEFASPGRVVQAAGFTDAELTAILADVTKTSCFGTCSKDTKRKCGRSAGWGNSFWKMLNGGEDTGFAWRGEHVCYCPEGDAGECYYHCKFDEQCVQFQDTAPHYDFGVCIVPKSDKEACERETKTVWEVILAASCFERGTTTMASSSPVGPWLTTPMEDVMVGDYVVAMEEGQLVADRVWANLHLADDSIQNMLEITHELGVLSLTPDHMLMVDGRLQAARTLHPGQHLHAAAAGSVTQEFAKSEVLKVSQKIGRIVNPVTHSGYIVAADDKGIVISASTITESVDNVMLDTVRLRSFGKVASAMFPAEVQASSTVETTMLLGVVVCKTMPAIFSLVFCFFADNIAGLIFILAHSSTAKAFIALAVASRILKVQTKL